MELTYEELVDVVYKRIAPKSPMTHDHALSNKALAETLLGIMKRLDRVESQQDRKKE